MMQYNLPSITHRQMIVKVSPHSSIALSRQPISFSGIMQEKKCFWSGTGG